MHIDREQRTRRHTPIRSVAQVAGLIALAYWVSAGGEPPPRLYAASPGYTPAPADAASISGSDRTEQNPFVGSWNSTDPSDGSTIHVTIANAPAGSPQNVRWREDAIELCGGVRGRIEADGERVGENTLRLSDATIECPKAKQTVDLPDSFGFIHSPDSDTLAFWFFQGDEPVFEIIVCFHRSGSPESCA